MRQRVAQPVERERHKFDLLPGDVGKNFRVFRVNGDAIQRHRRNRLRRGRRRRVCRHRLPVGEPRLDVGRVRRGLAHADMLNQELERVHALQQRVNQFRRGAEGLFAELIQQRFEGMREIADVRQADVGRRAFDAVRGDENFLHEVAILRILF